MNFNEEIDFLFSDENLVLSEVSIMPAADLDRIMHQSEVRRVVSQSGSKGEMKTNWDGLFDALNKKDKNSFKKSLAQLITGYSLVIQFLGQPRNKRLDWIKNFMKNANQVKD